MLRGYLFVVFVTAVSCAPTKVHIPGQGTVQGFVSPLYPEVRQFLGIPFAQPPIGPLRWSPPQAPHGWAGVRNATSFAPSCLQNGDALHLYGKESEDCLYLNVFTPTTVDRPLPVMLWIYGGSFVHGGADLWLYEGDHMAHKGDVVVITINYRLGALGFFVNDELAKESSVTGNYGLLDQQAAMAWAKASVAAFGGDPNQITIFGESAGSMSVCFHLVMPASRGLFEQAIMESGPCLQGTKGPHVYYNFTERTTLSNNLLSKIGCDSGTPSQQIACARSFPGVNLTKLQTVSGLGAAGWFPVVDGKTIPEDPITTFNNGQAAPVNVLIGTNTNEGTMFLPKDLTPSAYTALIGETFPDHASAILQQYPLSDYPSPWWAASTLETDFFFVCPSRRLLRLHNKQTPTLKRYQYHFSHIPSWVTCPGIWCTYKGEGVFHTAELYFVWDNPPPLGGTFSAEEKRLSSAMLTYWTSFARSGVPASTPGVSPSWPVFDVANHELYQVLNTTTIYNASLFDEQKCDFWDSITSSLW